MPDYYDILGLAHDADAEEVKAAFHRLAKISHPDLNAGDATAVARFKIINQAYETLSDSEKRATYDLEFRGGPRVYRHTAESRASATNSSAIANHAPSSSQRWLVAASAMCIGLLLGFVVVPTVLWLNGTFAGSQKAKTVPALPSASAPGEFGSGAPVKVAKIAVLPIDPTIAGPLEPRAVELAPPLQPERNTAPPDTSTVANAPTMQLPDQHDDRLAQATRRSEHGDVADPGLTVDTSALAPAQPAPQRVQIPQSQDVNPPVPFRVLNSSSSAKPEAEQQRLAMLQQQEVEERRAEAEAAKEATKTVDAKSLGRVFRDCPDCPEMVVVPAGSFMMGSNAGNADEKPVHKVTITKPFAVGKFDVTFAEWDACVTAGGCTRKPEDQGWGRSNRPVINVSWDDATKEYLPWLSRKTSKAYRPLTEAEWEYAARAGTTTTYFWGNDIGRNRTNCIGCGSQWDNKQTAPAGSFASNGFGLFDMHGNVYQWVQDCYHDSYQNAPTDGSVWMQSCEHSGSRVVRGGSWNSFSLYLSATGRSWGNTVHRNSNLGFRLARTLDP